MQKGKVHECVLQTERCVHVELRSTLSHGKSALIQIVYNLTWLVVLVGIHMHMCNLHVLSRSFLSLPLFLTPSSLSLFPLPLSLSLLPLSYSSSTTLSLCLCHSHTRIRTRTHTHTNHLYHHHYQQ